MEDDDEMRPTVKERAAGITRVPKVVSGRAKGRVVLKIELIKPLPAPVYSVNGRELYLKPVRDTPAIREEVIPASVLVNGRGILANALIPKPLVLRALSAQEARALEVTHDERIVAFANKNNFDAVLLAASERLADPANDSDFPSLSSNASHPPQSTWSMPSASSIGGGRQEQRLMGGPPPSQARQQVQQQQDEFLSSSSQLPSSPAGFRYGGQNPVGRASQQEGSSDDFPALRNGDGKIGQHRIGANNGLLNALNSGSRTSPNPRDNSNNIPGRPSSRSQEPPQSSAPGLDKDTIGFGRPSQSESSDNAAMRNPQAESSSQGAGPSDKAPMSFGNTEGLEPLSNTDRLTADPAVLMHGEDGPMIQDPLPGMSDKDRFGMKGLFGMLKGPFPDQAALVTGIDINTLGFDLATPEKLTEMIWSPFDDVPARPAVLPHKIPDCYQVHNVAPVEQKLPNFSDETLMMMFYMNPQDVQQMIAAEELRNRNWRFHKKLGMWLTKDEMMQPVQVGQGVERGYYIVFDPKGWVRERRELLLNYHDLETVPPTQNGPPMA